MVTIFITPPRNLVTIPDLGNHRWFGESLLAIDPWYGQCRCGVINNVTIALFRGVVIHIAQNCFINEWEICFLIAFYQATKLPNSMNRCRWRCQVLRRTYHQAYKVGRILNSSCKEALLVLRIWGHISWCIRKSGLKCEVVLQAWKDQMLQCQMIWFDLINGH
jgi:hypothetical protein